MPRDGDLGGMKMQRRSESTWGEVISGALDVAIEFVFHVLVEFLGALLP